MSNTASSSVDPALERAVLESDLPLRTRSGLSAQSDDLPEYPSVRRPSSRVESQAVLLSTQYLVHFCSRPNKLLGRVRCRGTEHGGPKIALGMAGKDHSRGPAGSKSPGVAVCWFFVSVSLSLSSPGLSPVASSHSFTTAHTHPPQHALDARPRLDRAWRPPRPR